MIMINTELLKWLLCDNRNPVEEEKQLLASNFTFFSWNGCTENFGNYWGKRNSCSNAFHNVTEIKRIRN